MLTAALLILFLRTGAGRTALEGLREGLGGLLTLEWIAESGTGVKPEGEFTEEGIRFDWMRCGFYFSAFGEKRRRDRCRRRNVSEGQRPVIIEVRGTY